jgi:hypothetical protein
MFKTGFQGKHEGDRTAPGMGIGVESRWKRSHHKIGFHWKAPTVAAYRATGDVPRDLAQFTAKLLAVEWRRQGAPRDSRALTCS